MDTDTIISDITDNNSIDSQKQDELRTKTDLNLNNLTNDQRRDKCNEMGLKHAGKMKKPELVQALLTEFMKLVGEVKDKKVNDLKAICKQYNLKFGVGTKKEELYWMVLNHCSDNLIFKLNEPELKIAEAKVVEAKVVEPKVAEPKIPEPKLSLLDQLEKQRQEIEVKMQEELKKQEEEIKRQEEELRREKEEAARREKEEAKKKKQSIPKNVRMIVWSHYIGEDIIRHRCLCCKKVLISNTNFEVGHVLSEKNGGTHEINNLRPICFACNHSMGTENMIDFVVKYGLYIG